MKEMMRKIKNVNPAAKGVIIFVVLLLTLSLLFAPTLKPVDFKEINFKRTESAQLYFNNIRSFYYDISPDPRSGFILYRLKRRNIDTTQVWLQFMIVNNRNSNESYIYADLNLAHEQWDNPRVLIQRQPQPISVSLRDLNNEDHFLLAVDVFNALLANERMFLLNGADTVKELYATKTENFTAAIALEDYFKLINKL